MKQVYHNIHDIENIFDSNLISKPTFEFKKSMSNHQIGLDNQFAPVKGLNPHLNNSNTLADSNLNEDDLLPEQKPSVSNGVIFSKVSRLNDKTQKLNDIIDDYQLTQEQRVKT